MTKEILSWLHEPVIVGEFGLHQTMEEIEFIAREMKLNEIQIPFCHPQKKELLFQKFLYTVDCPTEDDRPSTDLLVIKIKDVDIHDQLLKDFIFNNSVFIEADFTKENILYFVKELNPFGIQLSCKKKSKSGLSPVEEFSEILEMIGF